MARIGRPPTFTEGTASTIYTVLARRRDLPTGDLFGVLHAARVQADRVRGSSSQERELRRQALMDEAATALAAAERLAPDDDEDVAVGDRLS